MVLVIILHPTLFPLWVMDWLLLAVRQGWWAGSVSLLRQWKKDGVPSVDIILSSSAGRTLSVLERRCHAALAKGDNYLLEFLRGLVQFSIIILSLRVINTGIIPTSIWYVSSPFGRLSLDVHLGQKRQEAPPLCEVSPYTPLLAVGILKP